MVATSTSSDASTTTTQGGGGAMVARCRGCQVRRSFKRAAAQEPAMQATLDCILQTKVPTEVAEPPAVPEPPPAPPAAHRERHAPTQLDKDDDDMGTGEEGSLPKGGKHALEQEAMRATKAARAALASSPCGSQDGTPSVLTAVGQPVTPK